MLFTFLKKNLVNFPCLRKFLKNVIIVFSSRGAVSRRCRITQAKFQKTFLIRTCHLDNSYYGIDKIYRSAHFKDVFYEHGYFWGDIIIDAEMSKKIRKIYTISKNRAEILKQLTTADIQVIPPYITSVDECSITNNYLKENIQDYTLFIPGHSTKDFTHNQPRFHNKDNQIKLLYYIDMIREYKTEQIPENIACCGNINDPRFLPRLKSLIIGSKSIETDFLGTHVLYASALGKKITFTGNWQKCRQDMKKKYMASNYISVQAFENDFEYMKGLCE